MWAESHYRELIRVIGCKCAGFKQKMCVEQHLYNYTYKVELEKIKLRILL